MKTIKYINGVALGLPIFLFLLGCAYYPLWIYAMYATILTGFLQVVSAIAMLAMGNNTDYLYAYFLGVVGYFIFMHLGVDGYYLFATPPILAIYLTWIVYKKPTT